MGRTRFAHPVERELADTFDELGIRWEYEPHTFVLATDPAGLVRRAFTPAFYLPDQDLYVDCTTMRQRLTTRKNRKVRALRRRGKVVTVLNGRDFERLHAKDGLFRSRPARRQP